jgi:hypothetical protein
MFRLLSSTVLGSQLVSMLKGGAGSRAGARA